VNVQIKGLNYDKPHPKGFTLTPRSRKVIENEKAKQFFLYKSSKVLAKNGIKSVRKSAKAIKRRSSCCGCQIQRRNGATGCGTSTPSTGLMRSELSKGSSSTSGQISHFFSRNRFPLSICIDVNNFLLTINRLSECIRRYWGNKGSYKMSLSTLITISYFNIKRHTKCNMAHKCSNLRNLVISTFNKIIPTISDAYNKHKHIKLTTNILPHIKCYINFRYNCMLKNSVFLKYILCIMLICNKVKVNKIISSTVSFFCHVLTNKNIVYKCKIMVSLTIFLTLIRSGIEPNPGPQRNVEIITYNCNGLGDQNKLRRLLAKSNKKVQNGAIIFLQETHIVNTDVIR